MNFSTVTDWSIIKVTNDKNVVISQHLYGIIANNATGRFDVDDFICTSNIKHIDTINCKAITRTGNTYHLDGEGDDFFVSLAEFEELSLGATPFNIGLNRMLDRFDKKVVM